MKDPGPNVLEQIIKSNELLATIAASGAAPAGPGPILGGAIPSTWPALFYWHKGLYIPFVLTGTGVPEMNVTGANTSHYSADTAIRLQTRDAGHALNDQATLTMNLPPPVSGKVRAQLVFCPTVENRLFDFSLTFYYFDGTNRFGVTLWLFDMNDRACYIDSDNNVVELALKTFPKNPIHWTKLDLSADLHGANYHTACVQQQCWDLSAQAMRSVPDAQPPNLAVTCALYNQNGAARSTCYIDEILVTEEQYDIPS